MSAVTIRRLRTRLRCADPHGADPARLKRLQAEMLDRALEPALQRHGLDARGEWCIRQVVVPPVRVAAGESDSALVVHWADALADGIVRRAAHRDAGVQHYASRDQAVIDLTVSAMRGDFRRAWAWRQLGLWVEDDAMTPGDAAGLVTRALVARPAAAPTALAHLAASPPAFERWLLRSGVGMLPVLAQTVWREVGGSPQALRLRAADEPTGAMPWVVDRVLQRSAIAGAITTAAVAGWELSARMALALLVVAEAEPARLRAAPDEVTRLLTGLAMRWSEPASASAPRPEAPTAGSASAAATGASEEAPSASSPDEPLVRVDAATRLRHEPEDDDRAAHLEPAFDAAEARPHKDTPHAEPIDFAPADLRRRGRTRYAGLLFLLNLADLLGWPERLLNDAALSARGTRWTLHQLALQLLPLDADDPAALAFAGLRPGNDGPHVDQPALEAFESSALAQLRAELLLALRLRLRHPDTLDAELLAEVCQREAEIVADPGWLEVQLSLRSVSTTLRVAGLDLDPGWLPWLGLVIRFAYD